MAGSNAAPISNTFGALSTVNAGTLAAGSSSSTPISVTTLGNLITLHLTRDNFLLWKTQAVPALASNGLFGYVAGTEEAPPQTLIEGTGDAAVEVANPEFLRWFQKDQLVMIALLGSMTEDILDRCCSSARLNRSGLLFMTCLPHRIVPASSSCATSSPT